MSKVMMTLLKVYADRRGLGLLIWLNGYDEGRWSTRRVSCVDDRKPF